MASSPAVDDLMRKALEKDLRAWFNYHETDARGGVILIALGDPAVSVQYIGPNHVTTVELIEWVRLIATEITSSDLHIQHL